MKKTVFYWSIIYKLMTKNRFRIIYIYISIINCKSFWNYQSFAKVLKAVRLPYYYMCLHLFSLIFRLSLNHSITLILLIMYYFFPILKSILGHYFVGQSTDVPAQVFWLTVFFFCPNSEYTVLYDLIHFNQKSL